MLPVGYYIALSAFVFVTGAVGVLVRRNPIIMLMCIELMLNAGNLVLIAFSRQNASMDGHVFVFIVITAAAAEAAVGLGIIVAVFRQKSGDIDMDKLSEMKG